MTILRRKQIIDKANRIYSKQDYAKYFDVLFSLDADSFLEYLLKQERTSKGKVSEYFWGTFVENHEVLKVLLNSTYSLELLLTYFKHDKAFNKPLEKYIADVFPLLYVEAIKKSQILFNSNRIDFLCDEIILPDALKIHQRVWRTFYLDELALWIKIQELGSSLKKYKLFDILTAVIYEIESSNYLNSSHENQNSLGDIYSFFIDFLLRNKYFTENDINELDFREYFKSHVYIISDELKETINKLFYYINNRNLLFSTYVDPYCFEDDFKPTVINQRIRFLTTPQSHYKWKEDGCRYIINEKIYQERTTIGNPTELMLADLGITNYYHKQPIDLKLVVRSIFNLSKQYFLFYENKLPNYNLKNSTWLEAYYQYSDDIKPNFFVPFLGLTKNELTTVYGSEKTESIITVLQWSFNKTKFDRFNVSYNVFKKPFLKIKDFYFCPSLFFTCFTGVYSFVDALLYNNNKKKTDSAKEIETVLKKAMDKQNWKVFCPSDRIQIEGDSDIIAYDDNVVILMQLKRTGLKLNSKSRYNDISKIDNKASKQLNESEVFLTSANDVFKIGNRKVYKWIISTSFENVNTTINNCKKVSYFDIMHILFSNHIFTDLNSFINYIENDDLFLNKFKSLGLSLELDDVKQYNLDYMFSDNNSLNEFRELYNKGLQQNKQGNHGRSIDLLNECLEIEDQDIVIHGAIANVYADFKDFSNAKLHFEKALSLCSNDPFIERNYIGLLFEKGDIRQALNYCLDSIKKYPLIDELQEQFDRLFLITFQKKLLDFKELEMYSVKRLEI